MRRWAELVGHDLWGHWLGVGSGVRTYWARLSIVHIVLYGLEFWAASHFQLGVLAWT